MPTPKKKPLKKRSDFARKAWAELLHWLEGDDQRIEKLEICGFNMGDHRVQTSCGSVCCISGFVGRDASFGSYDLLARQRLEITELQADKLFYPDMEKHDVAYREITPQHASRTVRYFLRTGKIDWDKHYIKGEKDPRPAVARTPWQKKW